MAEKSYILVGTYMSADKEAIQVLSLDESGQLEKVNGISGIDSPSFLTISENKKYVYAVSEVEEGAVVAYSLAASQGTLQEINRQVTDGASPCYVSLNHENSMLFAVNYMGGSVCAFPLEKDGSISEHSDHIKHSGHSIHPERQEAPHPHTIVTIPSTKDQLVTDLGTDHLYVYGHAASESKWILSDQIDVVPGSGPRHIAFHPTKPFMYVIQELKSCISVYHREADGKFMLIETVNTLPNGFNGENTAAHIAVSSTGEFLYASNRGHDSIVSYKVGENGKLDCIGYTTTCGETPRHFLLIPNSDVLLVANQESHNIVVMRINEEGQPVVTEHAYSIESPVCLQYIR